MDQPLGDLYDSIAKGRDAKVVLRAMRTMFVQRREHLLRLMASAPLDGLAYAKIAGRVEEWNEIEREFQLHVEDGEEALTVIQGGK